MNITVFRPFKTGFRCSCGAAVKRRWDECTCPDAWRRPDYYFKFVFRGKQVLRTTGLTTKREARDLAQKTAEVLVGPEANVFKNALDLTARRRVFASIAEVIKAYEARSVTLVAETTGDRNVRSLRRVLAFARNLWTEDHGRIPFVGRTEKVVDKVRIGELSAGVLTDDLVMAYFSAACGGTVDFSEPDEDNVTINSTLEKARCVFARPARMLKMKHLALPDMNGFLTHPLLPEFDVEPEPVKAPEFAVMVAEARALPADDTRAWINLVLRQTGIRSGSLVHLHQDWLEKFEDGWTLHVRVVKGGTARYSIPVSDELAELLQGRKGYLLPGDEKERKRLVSEHSKWLKTILPETSSRSEQGNHRLRDTVAGIVLGMLDREASSAMLGNSRKVNAKHYARLRINVSDLMRTELAAALRLRMQQSAAPANVVTMPQPVAA